uniref:Uncharacterized protein n=1 Tax=Anguilla anguilla TaxID=7936 RepID=A0A0E9RKX8_ANGAN
MSACKIPRRLIVNVLAALGDLTRWGF